MEYFGFEMWNTRRREPQNFLYRLVNPRTTAPLERLADLHPGCWRVLIGAKTSIIS